MADTTDDALPPTGRGGRGKAPVVVLGGGHASARVLPAAFAAAARTLRRPPSELDVALVTAANPLRRRADGALYRSWFASAGATDAVDVGIVRRRDADRADVVERLSRADVLFLGGGSPEVLVDVLLDTAAMEAIVAAPDRGAMVVGFSAGGIFLGESYLRDGERGLQAARLEDMTKLLTGAAVVPHYVPGKDDVEAVLANLAVARPDVRIIAVDERGGVVFDGDGWSDVRRLAHDDVSADRGGGGLVVLPPPRPEWPSGRDLPAR